MFVTNKFVRPSRLRICTEDAQETVDKALAAGPRLVAPPTEPASAKWPRVRGRRKALFLRYMIGSLSLRAMLLSCSL